MRHLIALIVLGSLTLASSLSGAEPVASGTAPDLFASNRVVQVEITLAPADWDKLRKQERDARAEFSKDRLERPAAKPYSWFSADVIVDGKAFKNVGLRKRGFFGSSDTERPALNLELDHFVKGQKLGAKAAFKLHNNKQDNTSTRQVLAYQLFTAAGVPAPRCNLAHVTVNGVKLGVYSNLEPVDEAFLRRHFGSDNGNLYEAQISDFRPGWTRTFEKKNNPAASRADLDAVVQALQSEDSQLLDRLGRVLDVDAFINFWAMESLLNHWDGFNGDLNNAFVYHDPKADRLRFIAWGADATFGPHHVFVPFEPPASVWAVSFLARRLYNHPVTQAKYRARLQELLTTVWNEARLVTEVERLEKLTAGLSTGVPFLAGMEKAQMRQFIQARRGAIEAELRQPAKPWNHPTRREIYSAVVGKITADFSAGWVPSVFVPAPAGGKARVTLDFYGRQLKGEFTDVKVAPDIANPRNTALLLTGSFPGVEVPVSIWISTATNLFRTGATLPPNVPGNSLTLVAGQIGTPDFRLLGFWEAGTVKLEQVGTQPGGKSEGRIAAEISTIPWEDADLAKLKKAP
jgi:hypothetical protein